MSSGSTTGPIARGAGRAIVALRWLVVVAWVAGAVAAVLFLPSLGGAGASPLDDIIPADSPSLHASERATELFGAPAATDVVVVQRDPSGLSDQAITRHVDHAKQTLEHPDEQGILGAVPLVDVPAPGVRWHEAGTTALSYLFLSPDLNLVGRQKAARAYARGLAPEGRIGVTGAGPARLAQFDVIQDALPIVEIATLAVILLMVFLYFRSVLAPLVTLGTAALAYLVAIRVLAWGGEQLGADVPQEIEPLLVVLLLGLVTDYSVFFMAEARRRLLLGETRVEAARAATARVAPTVLAAGLIVAACSAALLAGKLEFFRVFGPGLALCALVVTAVALTLLPALLGLLGPRLFGRAVREARPVEADTGELRAIASPQPPGLSDRQRERMRLRFAGSLGAIRAARRTARSEGRSTAGLLTGRVMASRGVSVIVAVACVAGLAYAARDDLSLDLGVSYVRALPSSSEARTAGDDATRGFGPGVLAPSEIIVEQPGVGDRHEALVAVQHELASREHVGVVLGPEQQVGPLPPLLVADSGDAVRFVVLFDGDPTAAPAIDAIGGIERDLPGLLRDAGIDGASVRYGGETALAAETVDAVKVDMRRIAIAVAIVTVLLLALFLRALVAPLALLLAGALGFLAALGLTSLACNLLFGQEQLTYYVPLVGLVLLVALGSDYNVFIAGRIRAEARRRRLREAIAVAAPEASRAITVAGLTLAATFALLVIIPLRPFRELGILLTIGVLVDALVVRPLLIPALISLLGRAAWWPARPIRPLAESSVLARIAQLGGTTEPEARAMAEAVLRTLGERIGSRQARELAAHLPPELAATLRDPDGCGPFGYDEFIDRVAERETVERPLAARDAAAVMACLLELVPGTEMDYVRAALSEDYRPLLGDVPAGAPA
ncbi:MAG: MMPL family transporter [Solirubrobacteraceae bacterium]